MSRHRSPQGRRAHLGPPLFALPATAGVGAARSVPQPTLGLPVRFVATVVAGGALAAAGQQALVAALPAATDGANVLRLSVEQLLGEVSATPAPRVAVAPVVPAAAPVVADAAGLVKAAGLHEAARAGSAAVAPSVALAGSAASPVTAAPATASAAPRTTTASSSAPRTTQPATTAPRTTAPRSTAPRSTAPRSTAPRTTAPAATPEAAAAAVAGGVQVITGRVSSGFGPRWGVKHEGLDVAAPIGTPIHAPLAGTVISSGPATGFGLWVRLQHADGTITVYGHINRSLVTVGQRVQAGQVIAESGNRGDTTGPHLHIGVMINRVYVDPRPWLDQHGIRY